MKEITSFLLVAALLLTACSQRSKTSAPVSIKSPTEKPTEQTAMPSPKPKPTGVTLTYEDNAQVELITPIGRYIYIDIYDPGRLTKDPSADDVLLTTHLHNDHYSASFVNAFPGQQIFDSTGKIEFPDVTIIGLASAHNASDPFLDKGGTDYIFVIDTGGLRIVHFGDIGQEALTNQQLTAIGPVDVAITQFSNSFSNMNATNLKGFNLMDQVNPRLIIPTHSDNDTIKIAVERWAGYYSDSRTVTLSTSTLSTKKGILILGNLAIAYGAIYNLKPWK